MQIKFLPKFFVLFLAAFLVACSSSGPEAVAEKYTAAVINADMDGFMSTINISEEEKAQMNMMRGKLEEMFKMAQQEAKAAGGLKSVKATKTTYSNNKKNAQVFLRISFKNGTSEETAVNMVETKNGWKVSP